MITSVHSARLLAAVLAVGIACGGPAAAAAPARHRAPLVYEVPAQNLRAGPLGANPFWAVLPSGRLVKPAGRSALVGPDARGVAISADGRYAVVSGSTLGIVDLESMTVVARYSDPANRPFANVATEADPRNPAQTFVLASLAGAKDVALYSLSATGQLSASRPGVLTLPASASALAFSRDAEFAYALNGDGAAVSIVDVRARRLQTTVPTEGMQRAEALGDGELLVCGEAPGDAHTSSLTFVPLAGDVPAGGASTVPLEKAPDGVNVIGGAEPSALAVTPDDAYVYVALANVDRVAVVPVHGNGHAAAGIDLRLFPRGPYGTRPSALALSHDGKRLYVALAGIDAIAVLDASNPLRLRRLGLIPTAWDPSALAISSDDRVLLVANTRGLGAEDSTLQRIDLNALDLVRETYVTLGNTRVARTRKANVTVPVLGSRASHAIRHVLAIEVNGDRNGEDAPFDLRTWPNLQALARTFASSDNFYPDSSERKKPARFGTIYNSLIRHRVSFRAFDEPTSDALLFDLSALLARKALPSFSSMRLASSDDRTLGLVVSAVMRSPLWKQTAILIDAPGISLAVSPYAKRGYLGHHHLSSASVLKTEEELLGLPPLGLGDLLASDLGDLFTSKPNLAALNLQAGVVPQRDAEASLP
ncbi:MAG: bifunctional YncE family protein/alkaline phosphatase family protein [Candidatus Eremiobacteraeota bacterium]|nr:bifunctional YncE family protein/alkaline phosphatase family protein [Candidatus Eremiobacteraeota bacterium]